MPQTLRTAVIGVGYLGCFHAEKYASLPQSQLVAVCDTDTEQCQRIAKSLDYRAVNDSHELIGQVDAVSIVVPTALHYSVTKTCLENGIHVLLEKPMASTVSEAEKLIQLAKQHQCTLQIGHLERFNPALTKLDAWLDNPQFIESIRLSPFKLRGTDINVILDLMIHDIDIILSIVKAPIEKIDANGASVLSQHTDIAHARITFTNGCVANVTASRISTKPQRKLRLFQPQSYISVDLHNKHITRYYKGEDEQLPGIPSIHSTEHTLNNTDALYDEIHAFLNAIIQNTPPIVSGEEGKQALATAIEITRIVMANPQHNLMKQHAPEED